MQYLRRYGILKLELFLFVPHSMLQIGSSLRRKPSGTINRRPRSLLLFQVPPTVLTAHELHTMAALGLLSIPSPSTTTYIFPNQER